MREANMTYYFPKRIHGDFGSALERVRTSLATEGFGILSEIDVSATMKKKLDIDFRRYTILGACNPPFAHRALQLEDKIGTMLPCNVIVQEIAPGEIEVAAVDPVASMRAIDNPGLHELAGEVRAKLERVINLL